MRSKSTTRASRLDSTSTSFGLTTRQSFPCTLELMLRRWAARKQPLQTVSRSSPVRASSRVKHRQWDQSSCARCASCIITGSMISYVLLWMMWFTATSRSLETTTTNTTILTERTKRHQRTPQTRLQQQLNRHRRRCLVLVPPIHSLRVNDYLDVCLLCNNTLSNDILAYGVLC